MVTIQKTFVINLKHRKDRWNKINNAFNDTNLKLERFEAVYGKDLSDDYIKKVTTDFCYEFCSPGMIGCWLSHVNLWKHIIQNNYDNVLILEDDAFPEKDFNERIVKTLSEIPKKYDIVYFGCIGTCDKMVNKFFGVIDPNKQNKKVIKNGIELKHIIKPGVPLATHAYLISNKGARRLLANKYMKKIMYHIDYILANYVFNDEKEGLEVFAVIPPLINQGFEYNSSDIASSQHPIINQPLSNIKINDNMQLNYLNGINVLNIRFMGVSVSYLFLMLLLLSIILGNSLDKKGVLIYLTLLMSIYMIEIFITHGKDKKTMLFEIVVIVLVTIGTFYFT